VLSTLSLWCQSGYHEDDNEPSKSDGGGGTLARLRLMLPSGQRLERKFKGTDKIEVVQAFLMVELDKRNICEGSSTMENFQLHSNYPKKALTDLDRTLEEEGLCPQAVIMVQDLDA